MYIEVGNEQYELFTKLGIAAQIEKRFKQPLQIIFEHLDQAETSEMVDMLMIAAKKNKDDPLRQLLLDEWDFMDLMLAVQDLIMQMMFSGTPEQNARKIERLDAPEERKNAMRAKLGIAPVNALASTGEESSEPDIA